MYTLLKLQFARLVAMLIAGDYLGYLNGIPGILDAIGRPALAGQIREMLHGLTTDSAREIVKASAGLVTNALGEYFGFEPIRMEVSAAVPAEFGDLVRAFHGANLACERRETADTKNVGPVKVGTDATAGLDPAMILTIFQMVMAVLKAIQDRRHPV